MKVQAPAAQTHMPGHTPGHAAQAHGPAHLFAQLLGKASEGAPAPVQAAPLAEKPAAHLTPDALAGLLVAPSAEPGPASQVEARPESKPESKSASKPDAKAKPLKRTDAPDTDAPAPKAAHPLVAPLQAFRERVIAHLSDPGRAAAQALAHSPAPAHPHGHARPEPARPAHPTAAVPAAAAPPAQAQPHPTPAAQPAQAARAVAPAATVAAPAPPAQQLLDLASHDPSLTGQIGRQGALLHVQTDTGHDLQIALQLRAQVADVRLVGPTAAALGDRRGELVEAFRQSGLELGRLDVAPNLQSNSSGTSSQSPDTQGRDGGERREAAPDRQPARPTARQPSAAPTGRTKVDIEA
jgi:hypothetical protein